MCILSQMELKKQVLIKHLETQNKYEITRSVLANKTVLMLTAKIKSEAVKQVIVKVKDS